MFYYCWSFMEMAGEEIPGAVSLWRLFITLDWSNTYSGYAQFQGNFFQVL